MLYVSNMVIKKNVIEFWVRRKDAVLGLCWEKLSIPEGFWVGNSAGKLFLYSDN